MSCSYEEYLEHLRPTKFYGQGISRAWVIVYVVAPAPLGVLFWWGTWGSVAAGYAGVVLIALGVFVRLRRSSMKHWSTREAPVTSLSERNVRVERARVQALIDRFDPDPELATRGLIIELDAAEKELAERRRTHEIFPRWYGAVLLALLATGLRLVPESPKALEVLGVLAAFATAALGVKHLMDAVLETPTANFRGYVSLLRRAKRRLDHDALRRKATIKPAA